MPVPVAFVPSPLSAPPPLHPAEGTRLRQPDSGTLEELDEEDDEEDYDEGVSRPPDEHAIGEEVEEEEQSALPTPPHHRVPEAEPPRTVRHGRYEPIDTIPVQRTMPRVYRRHRVLGLWYVPVAILVGAAVAFVIAQLADGLLGDDEDAGLAPLPTATPTQVTPEPTSPAATPPPDSIATTPIATATPGEAPSPTPVDPTPSGPGVFNIGDRVVVTGTGDCLRVRSGPTTQAAQLSCIGDGTEAGVLAGPAEADGFIWWKILAEGVVEGWAVERFLQLK
ncbi:MAG TPA: hypothetical protein QGF35_07890 [Dehalococcoidia bacterium]|nr:hypothetical protein [Dehalococcoidia bacterium]